MRKALHRSVRTHAAAVVANGRSLIDARRWPQRTLPLGAEGDRGELCDAEDERSSVSACEESAHCPLRRLCCGRFPSVWGRTDAVFAAQQQRRPYVRMRGTHCSARELGHSVCCSSLRLLLSWVWTEDRVQCSGRMQCGNAPEWGARCLLMLRTFPLRVGKDRRVAAAQ